ncbi:thiamine pyrophosphate-binding protein [Roseinatronobacter bogoriensis subsp. barguzinensis]|uniref:Thiamine pyrophosphate-binding protein n=1 Tax=Roseinatronobacter bogoriensis subsp. barguzinensis TaxID=441209 RepID=A0A2K8KEZ0_9RHOB|nr:thiamine pyrophosphate-binding protein [Rhodobaca barguzinensis]
MTAGGLFLRDHQTTLGADALIQCLRDAGVTCIFSLSGNQIMPVYDAILDSGIRLVHVRHEAAAVYMAEAWAQLTGQIGVALVTAGAGFGNALGALISARASETPVLLLSGDSPRGQDGMGAFQEMDQVAMARPITKFATRASTADQLPGELAQAIATAHSGRPGPVHLALPVDVLTSPLEGPATFDATPDVQDLRQSDAEGILAFMNTAQRPLVLVGPAMARTRTGGALAQLESALNAPVICMESPRGLRDPSLGALIDLTRNADRILLLGKSADFTTGFLGKDMGAPDARFAIIAPEEAELARARARIGNRLDVAAQADALPALRRIVSCATHAPDRAAWLAEAKQALALRADLPADTATHLHPIQVGAAIEAQLARAPGSVLICDGGEFGQWMQAIRHDGPRVINGVSGAIGAGPAYAIAASIACPDVPVIAAMGDGTAGFLLAEYETAAREGARFTAVIGNDNLWNAEHQIQIREFGADRTHGCTLSSQARYDLSASALGGFGVYVDANDPAALQGALDQAQASGLPACVNVRIVPAPAPVVQGKSAASEATH